MTPERWERLKPLFHGALEQPPSRRAEWLRDQCPHDEGLREDVLALARAHDASGGFLDAPAELSGALDAGHRLGPYVIRGELGRGGMGIVYVAEDVRLGRTVALKALPSVFAGDPQRRERLRREARAAAAFSHPGIATVYALEEFDGELYIASEHVKGRTLRAELADGPAGPRRALETAVDIARALCAAHEAGIIHRDLKPENVLRTPDGGVKLLDFGIAQFADRTLTQLTLAGAAVGTPAYMAPEQLVGAEVDFRADVYALGVLLVEMATGTHPLRTGEVPELPPALHAIAERCLARDPRDRYASVRELLADLESAQRNLAETRRAGALTPIWWWEFHQATTSLCYCLMALPLWHARGAIGGRTGWMIFVAALAAIIVSTTVRLHLWFTSHFYPGELPWVRRRARNPRAAADWIFAAAITAAGMLAGETHAALSTTLVSVGIGAAVAFLVIEPGTERAAFGKS